MRITTVAGWAALLLCGGCTGLSSTTPKVGPAGDRVGLLGAIDRCGSAASPPSAEAIANARSVQFLSNFSASDAAGSIFPPNAMLKPIPENDPIRTALLNALSLADPHFLARLCKDNRFLFVQTDAATNDFSDAYSFWQTKQQAGSQQPVRFISIPIGVFTSPPSYAAYELRLINAVIRKNANDATKTYQLLAAHTSFDDDGLNPAMPRPPSEALALLAIIAHEEGHILAKRRLLRDSDNLGACRNPDGKDFTAYGWKDPGKLPPFHEFGKPVPGATHAGPDPFPATIANASIAQGTKDVVATYRDNHFASLFAALAPDDDAAEAFKYRHLKHNTWSSTHQPLRLSLTLADNSTPVDVIANLAKGNNALKESCIENNEDEDDSY